MIRLKRHPFTPAALVALAAACNGTPPPGADRRGESPPAPATQQVGTPTPEAPATAAPTAPATAVQPAGAAAPGGYTGPCVGVTDGSAGGYGDASFTRKQKRGYLRS